VGVNMSVTISRYISREVVTIMTGRETRAIAFGTRGR
jgi:hypothetical protein